MKEIADAVGINKASLYSHYSGKDDLFLVIYEDVVREHGKLFDRLLKASKDLAIPEKLQYNFTEYIIYFYRNAEIQLFSNISLFHIPTQLREKLRSDYLKIELHYRKELADIFNQGMQQGIINKGDAGQKIWSFKAKRDGVLGWLSGSPELTEDSIKEFWHDFWFGVIKRNKD